jgi:hypothetical protein
MESRENRKTEQEAEMVINRRNKMVRQGSFAALSAGTRILASESGIALAMVLILSAIALAVMAALIYMLTAGTQISGMQKRYRTAQEAGLGGADITYQLIAARGNPNIPLTGFSIPATSVGGVNCLVDKMTKPTANWNAACSNTPSINPSVASSYDMTFQLGTSPTYTVFSKIVDTVEGNSGGDEGLIKGGVVTSTGEINVVSVPYLYTLEVDTENTANPAERAKYSILYQY